MATNNLCKFITNLVVERLEKYTILSQEHCTLLKETLIPLMDSKMLIEDSFVIQNSPNLRDIKKTLPSLTNENKFITLSKKISHEGIGKHFQNLTIQLFAILLSLSATPLQQQLIREWAHAQHRGCFLFTDRGGASLNTWHSFYEEFPDKLFVNIDKVWAIDGDDFGFAVVGVRKLSGMMPLLFLLTPDQCAELKKSKVGSPFFDDYVQLGNASGELSIKASQQLGRGNLTLAKQFLTLARPRFVMNVLAHLEFLENQSRLQISTAYHAILNQLQEITRKIIYNKEFSNHLINDVFALKYATNAFLQKLVMQNSINQFTDQRDLLALSKMEGSSYRCLFEIYQSELSTRVVM